MEELVLFGLTYLFVFVIYQIFIISPAKKRKMKNIKTDKEVFEVKYLVTKYKLDLEKISYNQLIQICALVSSLDISIAVTVMTLTKNFILEMLLGFGSIFILIFISYHLVYLFYKKKGMIKNEL